MKYTWNINIKKSQPFLGGAERVLWELQRHLAPPWRRHWICHCKYTYSKNSSVISEQICCRWRILIKTNKIKSLNDYENVIKSGKDPASGVLMKADLWSASPWRTAEATRAPRDVSVLVSAAEPNRAELRWDTAGRGNREGDTPLEAVSALHWYTNLSEIRSVCDGGGIPVHTAALITPQTLVLSSL